MGVGLEGDWGGTLGAGSALLLGPGVGYMGVFHF